MRFDRFIQTLDMGKCEDQLQRQALFDLVLFLVVVDGVITDSEADFMHKWLETLEWNSVITKDDYYNTTLIKCYDAIEKNTAEDFLTHRAKQLVDQEIKKEAMKLVRDIASVDGELDKSEKKSIAILSELLE
ncbi:MAG: putative tellurite resistance protein B-like protein [Paraglaciecola sp.]|jgi:uncharacterized tellurite resistance protein B-like protein